MSIPYTQASMALVRAVEGTHIAHPFIEDGDPFTQVYNMVCTQRESDYNSGQISLDTTMASAANAGVIELPFPADSNAYFVGDSGHTPIGGGMIQFTRTFSNIPKEITIPSGSAFVTFPGILNGHLEITDASMSLSPDRIIITVGANHNLEVGADVYIRDFAFEKDDGVLPPRDATLGLPDRWNKFEVAAVDSTTEFQINVDTDFWDGINYTLTVLGGEAWNKEANEYVISSLEMNGASPGFKINTSTTNTINVGETINVFVNFTVGSASGRVRNISSRYPVLSKDGNKLIIDPGIYFTQQDNLYITGTGRVANTGDARSPQSLNVNTVTNYKYLLPGVQLGLPDAASVNIPQVFRVVDQNTGDVTPSTRNGYQSITPFAGSGNLVLVENVLPTIPNSSEYLTMVNNKSNIVIESSLTEWAGNILLLKTKTCRAI